MLVNVLGFVITVCIINFLVLEMSLLIVQLYKLFGATVNSFVIRSKCRNVFFCIRELSADGFGAYAGTSNRLDDCGGVNPLPAAYH